MKISCHCGAAIIDQTDDLPQKGHLIPDQEWFATFDTMDDQVIVPLRDGTIDKKTAFRLSRDVLRRAARHMYQCSKCGRLYIEDRHRVLRCYVPSDDTTPGEILRSRDDA